MEAPMESVTPAAVDPVTQAAAETATEEALAALTGAMGALLSTTTAAANASTALNGTFNISLEDYLLLMRGPKHLPLEVVLPITIVYVFIAVTGIVGNVAVCAVIVRTADLHTATNYYLFSLAVSDLLLLILGLPNDLSVYWQQYPWALGEVLCKIRAVVSEMMSYTSVLTIVAFSMERYLAICHPLYSYSMKGLRRALRIILAVWLVSLVSAVPFAAYTTVDYIDYPPGSGNIIEESGFCAMLIENIPAAYPVYELSSLVFFFLPMVVMIFLYVRMALTIWRPHSVGKRVEGSIHRKTKQSQNRKSIIRMLAAVVLAFFLCWAPFHLQRLLYIYGKDSPNYLKINEWMYYITGCFYYFSSTVNPILYNVMSARYRDAFFKTLCCMNVQRSNSHENSSFQETTVCYTSSTYGHNRSLSRYNRYSEYHDGEVTVKDNNQIENYCAMYQNNHSDNSPPDVVVISSNGKTESILNHKIRNKNLKRDMTCEIRTDNNKYGQHMSNLCKPWKPHMQQQETCI